MKPIRTVVDLPEDPIEALRRLGEREGLSRAVLLRRAVAACLGRQIVTDDADGAYGLWRRTPVDGRARVEQLRDEGQR